MGPALVDALLADGHTVTPFNRGVTNPELFPNHTFAGKFPLWRPDPSNQGLYRISSEKAFKAGWQTRAFEETAFDCLDDFYSTRNAERPNFLSPGKEKEVLSPWAPKLPASGTWFDCPYCVRTAALGQASVAR